MRRPPSVLRVLLYIRGVNLFHSQGHFDIVYCLSSFFFKEARKKKKKCMNQELPSTLGDFLWNLSILKLFEIYPNVDALSNTNSNYLNSLQGGLRRPLARSSLLKCIIDNNGVTHRQTDRLLKITELRTDKLTDYCVT